MNTYISNIAKTYISEDINIPTDLIAETIKLVPSDDNYANAYNFVHIPQKDQKTNEEKNTAPLVQNNESLYDFLSRVCYEHGEYFFYEGDNLKCGCGTLKSSVTKLEDISPDYTTVFEETEYNLDFTETKYVQNGKDYYNERTPLISKKARYAPRCLDQKGRQIVNGL